MCGLAGFCGYGGDFSTNREKWLHVLLDMNDALNGFSGTDEFLDKNCGLNRTFVKTAGNRQFHIVFNGEIYNTAELKKDLSDKDFIFESDSAAEVVLSGFIHYGADFINKMNGFFSFAVWDTEKMYLFRDRSGIKPLFYAIRDNMLVFGSGIKALFAFPGIKPVIDKHGLCEIFATGPARTPGSGVFKGINEILPGHYAVYSKDGLKDFEYWNVESKPHTDTYAETLEKTRFLVSDAIKRQMGSDTSVCSLLSGGVDSSIVTAVASDEMGKRGERLNSFSFDFKDNDIHFKANDFQPDRDRPWVEQMAAYLGTKHRYLECGVTEMADSLYDVVDARDLPGMADVDSSLLYFCKIVKQYNPAALTGECSDEIFGGYPWFHSREAFDSAAFPWSRNTENRKILLSEELLRTIDIDNYASERYLQTVSETPVLDGENAIEKRRREIAYLNLKWFMSTLIDRTDRMTVHAGLAAKVPFADHRIIEYIWNVPWEIKCKEGIVKSLLRESFRGVLPDEILFRKKSPYPKSYNPAYEKLLGERLNEVLSDNSSPVIDFLDRDKVKKYLASPQDYGKPWFGQLMAGPQMLAYILQVNYWLKKYAVSVEK